MKSIEIKIEYMKKLYTIILLVLFALTPGFIYSQDEDKFESITREEIMQMSLEDLLALPFEDLLILANKLGVSIDDLLKMKTTVASKTVLTPRETPGIISIITEEEIKNSGARDLVDVIKLIPGLNIQYDDAGVFGIQMRGNWGFEGKVLVLMDGQEFNDLKYYVVPFGHHFNLQQIKRIEIIRGPGSSIYGGNAELGVINIITKDGNDLNGISVFGDFGFNGGINGFRNFGLNAGKQIGKWDIALKSSINRSLWTDREIIDYDSSIYIPADSSALVTSYNINLSISSENLGFRLIADNYKTNYITDSSIYVNEFKTILGEVIYDFKPISNFTISPKISFRNSIPYYGGGWYLNNSISRYTANVTANWDINRWINIVGGTEYYYDYARMIENTDSSLFYIDDDTSTTVSFNNIALYLQSIIKTKYFNLIIGGRYDKHSFYGDDFAPRIGLTKALDAFHFKVLYSKSFRSPSFGNIEFNPDIKPENTIVAEIELGYKLNNNMFLTANIFDISIKNPIIWYVNEYDEYGYINEKKTGTQGFEIEYKIKYNWGFGTINYSYYKPKTGNSVSIYDVPEHGNMYLGAPNNKVSMNSSFKINKTFNINPSLVYNSKAYGYIGELDEYIKCEQTFVFNLYLTANLKNFEFGAGVYDVFNQKPFYIQPYQGWNYPYPAPSRQFLCRVAYNFEFKD
jgi:outer membrane receptor for ferrienterochelin and colicin